MKSLVSLMALLCIAATVVYAKSSGASYKSSYSSKNSSSDVSVKSYVKKDGTHVQGYKRTNPDDTMYDNYSTKGNVNPYTGKEGTIIPYK